MGATNFDDIVCDDITCDDLACDDIACDDIVADDVTCDALVAGSLTLTTPLTNANLNAGLKRELIPVLFSGTLVDGSTNLRSFPMTRAGAVKAIYVAAGTRMVGGTNTWAFAKKNAATSVNLLSTANVNPINVPAAADVGEALTLTATAADLAFVAGDCIISTLVCGTMTTDGANYSAMIEVEFNDV